MFTRESRIGQRLFDARFKRFRCQFYPVIKCVVVNLAWDKNEAMASAKMQCYHCLDIVEQGTGTILALVTQLTKATPRCLWWE